MSQHLFPAKTATGRAVQVLIGYDRPLNGFFLVVTDTDLDSVALTGVVEGTDDDGVIEAVVYSNLDDVELYDLDGLTLDLGYFKAKLAQLGIPLPASIEMELHEDRRHRVGNRVCCYDADGVEQPKKEG